MIIRGMTATPLAPAAAHPAAPSGYTPLTDWGLIRASGADATPFLHGQLTQDVTQLDASHARLAAYCSPKGRMLASFVLFKRSPTELLLACKRDVLPATMKRLSMFVMRAKCQLSDATDAFELLGVVGQTATCQGQAHALDAATWAKADVGAADSPDLAHLLRLTPAPGDDGAPVERLLWCAPVGTPRPPELALATPQPMTTWDALEVDSGVAMVCQATAEAFVPQMLNYESVGGVNFKKGCYPGQEVVARSQYRGTLKRRTYRLACDQALQVGQEVFHSSDTEQACGTVAAAAPAASGGWRALVSMQTSAASGGTLTAGSPNGAALQLLPLPYELMADI
jgi:hypothetical protein